ncbi:acyltransferase family protein [Bradyrhizobium sp. UFLA05-153]
MGQAPGYRPEIDGLRAVAVSAVVFFHAYPEYVPGGFIGVDVFFVISGYLISGIIFDEVAQGSFTVTQFYTRRVRRLFPALILVMSTVLLASWFILLPDSFVRLGAQVAASSVFAANFYFWFQSGYFSPDTHTFPLLHLWSLGVEEQFYILWPLAVSLLAAPRRWWTAILLVGALSFGVSVLLDHHRDLDFYSPITRAWELMAGAILAWRERHAPLARVANPDAVVAIGLALVVASSLLIDQKADYPSWRAALPVAGSMLVIAGGARSRLAALMLSNRATVLTGKISYPLYLWHWPVLVLSAAVKFLPLTLLERGLAVVASYALAWATFALIETPIRFGALSSKRIGLLAGGMLATAIAGFVVVQSDGFSGRFPPELRAAAAERPIAWRFGRCLLDLGSQTEFADECFEHVRPLLSVWGDSTAGSLMPGLRVLQSRQPSGLVQVTASSCMPLLSGPISVACAENNERVRQILSSIRPDVVLLHANGPLDVSTRTGWSNTLAALKLIGPRIIVLGPVPSWKRGLPEQALSYYITRRQLLPARSSSFVNNLWDDEQARMFFTQQGAEYISAWQVFCNADGCLTRLNDHSPAAIDSVHLTEDSSIFLIDSIEGKLLKALRPRDK